MFADALDVSDRLVAELGTRGAVDAVWQRTRAYPTPGGLWHGGVLIVAVPLRSFR